VGTSSHALAPSDHPNVLTRYSGGLARGSLAYGFHSRARSCVPSRGAYGFEPEALSRAGDQVGDLGEISRISRWGW
jgi:hypothetical protein